MLRWMMYDQKTGDQKFIEMMRDFVKGHANQNASTESFKAYVDKHMKPAMDLEGNKRMDWFFRQWVYGTEIPRYKMEYWYEPAGGSEVSLNFTITQSDVSPTFKMIVPVYVDFDGNIVRLGDVSISGSGTSQVYKVKLPRRPKRVMINYYNDVLATESLNSAK
ncbi:MAG: hypothetical protein IPJ07_05560 [Acidobacteria bacterium]|nr:hypothetical protein [Acidobacteriota bacterium]